MKRSDFSRLRKNYGRNFKIGLLLSLSFVFWAFSWKTTVNHSPIEFADIDDTYYIDIIDMKPWTEPKPPPPIEKKTPPPVKSLEKIKLVKELPIIKETSIITTKPKPTVTARKVVPVVKKIKVKKKAKPVVVKPEPVKKSIIDFAQEMPMFPGCAEAMSYKERRACAESKMIQYMQSNINYPAIARENGIEGTVVLRFVVDEEGQLGNFEVLRKIGAGLTKEALRVTEAMPTWIPGKQNGAKVKVRFTLPVNFRLQRD